MSRTKDIRNAVENELSYDPLVDASNVTVEITDGEVALSGSVPVAGLAGVRSVKNDIRLEEA